MGFWVIWQSRRPWHLAPPLVKLQLFLKTRTSPTIFAVVVSAQEVAYGKPTPDIFLETANELARLTQCVGYEGAHITAKTQTMPTR